MLYTSKAVGEWLGITDRQVRNLRDQGVLSEVRPGVFDMKVCVRQYLNFKMTMQKIPLWRIAMVFCSSTASA